MLDNKLYHVVNQDCIEHMAEMEPASMDFAVFSPPFPSLYAYSSSDADIGNSEDLAGGDAVLHLSFFYNQLVKVVKPGRVIMVHVAQIPRMKRTHKQGGTFDFRGMNIRLGERAGLIWEYDWVVRKNPQSQAIRTRSRELQFAGLESDRANTRGCMPDYLLKFRVPGENAVPINSPEQVSRNRWIEWAECTWMDIRETDTLNLKGTKGPDDTKHICPLQLPVINRLVRLFSNPGETVFSPFAGIGSEGWESIKLGRRFYGCELNKNYFQQCLRNLKIAENSIQTLEQIDLYSDSQIDDEEAGFIHHSSGESAS